MKTIKILLSSIMLLFVAYGCGSSSSSVKVAPEMDAFMKQLNGTAAAVGAAVTQYGIEGLDKKDMDMYDLKDAKCVSADKDCYTMETAAGATIRTYVLCWEGGKIKSVEDKGMK